MLKNLNKIINDGSEALDALVAEESPVENAEQGGTSSQPALVEPAVAMALWLEKSKQSQPIGPVVPAFSFGTPREYNDESAKESSKRKLARESIEEIPKRVRWGVKDLTKTERKRRRVPTTVDSVEIRARAHVELSDLLMVNSKTNVHYTIEEVDRLNDFIQNAGNIRNDITRSGLSLSVLARHAEELWKELRSKYNALVEEASAEKAARLLLEQRVMALEVHNDSHPSIEVEDQVTHSEFQALREQNAALQATVEELSKTITELASAKPASDQAALNSEVSALREQNLALTAEVAALRETAVTQPPSESQSEAEATLSLELAKAQQEILSLREDLKSLKEEAAKRELESKSGKNKSKNQGRQKPKRAKGGAKNANPKPAVPKMPPGSQEDVTSPEGASQGGSPGDGSIEGNANDDFTVVNRRKPRAKHKPRLRNEAIAIKADEQSYASLLRNMRSNDDFKDLGEATKSVRRTRRNELLLILKKGVKPSSEYARLVAESVGSDEIKVRSLCPETTLQCKNLDETVTAEDLLDAITAQCLTGTLSAPVQLRKYNQGTQTATFKLPAKIAAMVLKVGKIKVNWSVCPVSAIERPTVCFRCLEYGHKSWACKGPDRSKLCRRCGAEGHQSKGCTAKAKCLICTGDGSNHTTGSYTCPSFRSAFDKLRPCK